LPRRAAYHIDRIKKPFYDSPRLLFNPIKKIEIKKYGNDIHISYINHDGIPFYSLKGYKIEIGDNNAG